MRRVALLTLTILAVAVALRGDVHACSCLGEMTPCEAFGASSAVFVGEVDAEPVRVDRTTGAPLPEGSFGGDFGWHFAVREAFSGVSTSSVVVYSGTGGGDCGIPFEVGATYLVYAHRADGRLHAGICSRTRPLERAEEDLAFLRTLTKRSAGGTLSGHVAQEVNDLVVGEEREVGALAGIVVTVRGTRGVVRRTRTDAGGTYVFAGLPTGEYSLKLSLPKAFDAEDGERELSLTSGGCATEDFQLRTDGRVGGRVLGYQWKSATPRVAIFLVPAERLDAVWLNESELTVIGDDGSYEFDHVAPGRYVVGLNLIHSASPDEPYPSTWYPGVGSRGEASVVELREGGRLTGLDFALPAALEPVTISGVVLGADGAPAADAYVSLVDERFPRLTVDTGATTRSDASGRFSIRGFRGCVYRVRASADGDDGPKGWSDWFSSDAAPSEVRVVLAPPAKKEPEVTGVDEDTPSR